MSVRLQKAIADAGITSRRKAETLIESGRVFLNDKKAHLRDNIPLQTRHIVYFQMHIPD